MKSAFPKPNFRRLITGGELDAILDPIEPMMERHDQVHVFVETQSIHGIDIASLGHHAKRALPLVGKLRQFGRIAVVADQAWIRAGTRIESALLPLIIYHTFLTEDGDVALNWVKGHAQPSGLS